MFKKFLDAGLVVIPERNGVPLKGVKWSSYYKDGIIPSESELIKWGNLSNIGYGLVCGKPSNVIGIDIDTYDDKLANSIYEAAGATPCKKKGSKGLTAFYQYNGEQNHVWKTQHDVVCELLSTGRKTTIPPSIHPKTKRPYEWLGAELIGCDLPKLDNDFIDFMYRLYPKPERKLPIMGNDWDHKEVTASDAKEMLSYIDPNCSYEEWVSIGMGLCSEFGDGAFQLWDDWSKGGATYDKNGNMFSKWRSFHGEGVGIGTVVMRAQQGGWFQVDNKKPKQSEAWEDIDISDYIDQKSKEISQWDVSKLVEKRHNTEWLNYLTGDLKRVVDWMHASALYPHRVLEVGSAITALGTLMGHRYRTETDARTNFFIIGLAPSGSGKDHARKCAQRLFHDTNNKNLIGGQPASGVGVIAAVKKAHGRKLLQIDEMGRVLQSISGERSGSHERQIMTELMMFFSSANGVYVGREYANQDDRPTTVIEQPCLNVYGTTVEENLYDAITSRDAIDGFLSRWLLFRTEEDYPSAKRGVLPVEVGEEMMDMVKRICDSPTNDDRYGIGIEPKMVPFSDDARSMFYAYWDDIDKRKRDAKDVSSLLARMPEHIGKIALLLWSGTEEDFINVTHMRTARAIVEFCMGQSIHLVREHLTDGVFGNQTQKIYNRIQMEKAGCTKTMLYNSFKGLRRKDFVESLQVLADSGRINVERKGKKEVYFAL